MKSWIKPAAFSSVAFGCLISLASNSNAAPPVIRELPVVGIAPAEPALMENVCVTQDPDSTDTRDANIAELKSPMGTDGDPKYTKKTNGCKRWVADIKLVPIQGQTTSTLSLLWSEPVKNFDEDKAGCEALKYYSVVYVKKAGETQLKLWTGGTMKGEWVTSGSIHYCAKRKQPGWRDAPEPGYKRPTSGQTIIRVISSGQIGNDWIPMKATLG